MYTIRRIADLLGASIKGSTGDAMIQHLAFDSRRVSFPAKTLFFALRGTRNDGHAFIGHAYEQGVKCFVVEEEIDPRDYDEACFLLVPDTHRALQQLAAWHRGRFSLPVIGITGSNGKTWVKEWLFQMLHRSRNIVRSPRSYNSQIGVPLSVWQIAEDHNLGIFEAGISTTGEMVLLESIIRPDIGLFIMLGDAHAGGFMSMHEKLEEKAKLFKDTGTIIYCSDQKMVADYMQHHFNDRALLSWSVNGTEADLILTTTETTGKGQFLTYRYGGQSHKIFLPFPDHISRYNVLCCCLVLHHLGIDATYIRARTEELQPINMRLEIKEAPNRCLLINDSYSFDINSLQLALEIQQQYARDKAKTVILSDMAGEHNPGTYRQIAQLLDMHSPDRLIAIGSNIAAVKAHLDTVKHILLYPSTKAFLDALGDMAFHNEVILLKGARAFAFERIVSQMQARMHSAVFEIDFNAMLHNLQVFAGKLEPGVKMMVMVKAAAYGSGSVEVARFLELQHVDAFAVAYPDEGIELRRAGIQAPILVLNPEDRSLEKLIEFDLEPELYTLSQIRAFNQVATEMGIQARVHLKVDSGMHRLGFSIDQIQDLTTLLKQAGHVRVASVFSHLAASGTPSEDAFTHNQVDAYLRMYDEIVNALDYKPDRHILNSAGILRFPEYQFEMVRLGIGLYGTGVGSLNRSLEPVHTLKARISQVLHLQQGDSVGYDRAFIAQTPMRIATINVGYADGLMRRAGNGNYSLMLHDRRVPIIGNVCMDMCMIDISKIDEARVGDEVVVFGARLPVDDLARACETTAYEILSKISPRITRIYHMS